MCPRACALQLDESLQLEACGPQLKSRPHSLQVEEAHTQQQRPSTAKNKCQKRKKNRLDYFCFSSTITVMSWKNKRV